MLVPFDIFKVEKDGSLRWCEAAETFEAARARIELLHASLAAAAQYVILNQETGQRTVVERSGPAPSQTPPASPSHVLYHICRVDKEKLLWVEGAETLQIAEARVKLLKAFCPGDYLVLDYNPERGDPFGPWPSLTCMLTSLSL